MRKSLHGEVESILNLIDYHEQVFGAEHPDTLEAGHQLAYVLENQGFFGFAETTLEGILGCFYRTKGTRNLLLDKMALFSFLQVLWPE